MITTKDTTGKKIFECPDDLELLQFFSSNPLLNENGIYSTKISDKYDSGIELLFTFNAIEFTVQATLLLKERKIFNFYMEQCIGIYLTNHENIDCLVANFNAPVKSKYATYELIITQNNGISCEWRGWV